MVFNGVIRSVSGLRTVLQSVVFVPFLYTVFFNMIPTFLVAWENATRLQERFNDNFRGRGNTYDFIVGEYSAASPYPEIVVTLFVTGTSFFYFQLVEERPEVWWLTVSQNFILYCLSKPGALPIPWPLSQH